MLLVLTHFRRQAVTFSNSFLRIPTWFWGSLYIILQLMDPALLTAE